MLTMLGPKNIGKLLTPYDVEIQPLFDEIIGRECAIRECADEATMHRIQGTSGTDLFPLSL